MLSFGLCVRLCLSLGIRFGLGSSRLLLGFRLCRCFLGCLALGFGLCVRLCFSFGIRFGLGLSFLFCLSLGCLFADSLSYQI